LLHENQLDVLICQKTIYLQETLKKFRGDDPLSGCIKKQALHRLPDAEIEQQSVLLA